MVTFKFKNNNAQLKSLFDTLQGQQIIKEIAAKASVPPLKRLVKETFDNTQNPFAEKWAPLKKPTGRPAIQGLRDFFEVKANNGRVHISNTKDYAGYHQKGTKFIPRRQFLPELVIPFEWQPRIKPSIQRAIRGYLKGLVKREAAEYASDLARADSEGFGGG